MGCVIGTILFHITYNIMSDIPKKKRDLKYMGIFNTTCYTCTMQYGIYDSAHRNDALCGNVLLRGVLEL